MINSVRNFKNSKLDKDEFFKIKRYISDDVNSNKISLMQMTNKFKGISRIQFTSS